MDDLQSSLPSVLHNAIHSSWPISIIDMDRSIVLVSAPFPKHGVNKMRYITMTGQKNVYVRNMRVGSVFLTLSRCRRLGASPFIPFSSPLLFFT